MHKLKITYLSGRTFFSLSFGEKKKISIAGVFVTQPSIIILDEPTIGLDPWTKNEFYEIIENISNESSIIIATHDYDLLKQVQKILFLWDGKFIKEFHDFDAFLEFSNAFIPNRE